MQNASGERGLKLYHFPIYYEEILRGFLLKLAMSEILEGDDVQNCGIRKVMDRGNLSLFFGYLNVLCKREEYLSSTQEIVDHPLVEQVTGYIEAHIGEEITVEDVAETVHMSKFYFLRKFKEITGMTVHNFIVNKRIIAACQIMAEGKNITERLGSRPALRITPLSCGISGKSMAFPQKSTGKITAA